MDRCSHTLANLLVGNPASAATLEVTLLGPELAFETDASVAIAGAEFDVTRDGVHVDPLVPFDVRAGSSLKFGDRLAGARAYLAIAGGFTTPPVFGSRSTHLVSGMGGFCGRALKAGDLVPFGGKGDDAGTDEARAAARSMRIRGRLPRVLDTVGATATGRGSVRVLPGPHVDWFAAGALDLLQAQPYSIDARSDRMGFRLQGAPLPRISHGEMTPEATLIGTLQVPASGQPILLMADRQTSGGYPALASVISADIGIAGQLAPGHAIRFTLCDAAEAFAACHAQEAAMREFADACG